MATPSEFKKLTDPTIPFQSGTVALNDLAHIVDVSDTSGGAAGTSKRTPVQKIFDAILAAFSDSSTTVKGITKLSVAPVSPTDPIAVGDNDPRNSNARTPTAHASTHTNGTDDIQSANGSQKGVLTAADWTAFNGKAVVISTDKATISAGILAATLNPNARYIIQDASAGAISVFATGTGSITTAAILNGNWDGTTFTFGTFGRYSLSEDWFIPMSNQYAAAPTNDEDFDKGYVVNDIWIDTTTSITYKCIDVTTGAAVWQAQSFNIISITYSDLVTAISNSTLVKLGWYLLTDFELTHEIPNSEGATWTSPVEPILIQAIDVNKLADYGHSQTWLGEVVYYTTDNNQSAVLGCTKGYVRRRVNNRWKLDFGTDYRNNRYRRFAVNVTNTYDGATIYAQYAVVEDGSGVVYGSLQAGNLGNALTDELFWVNLGYNNGEYWGVTGTTWNIGNYTIDTDAADFEDRPMLDPTDLDSGNYFNGTIEQSADETGFNFGLNQLNNIVVKLYSTMYGFTLSNSSMYAFTMSYSSLYGFTLSSNSILYDFTMSGSSLYAFTMSSNSILYDFTMSGSSLYDFTMSYSSLYGFTLSGYSTMYGFTLSGYSTMYDFTLSNSSLYGFTLSDSSLYVFTMSYSSLLGFTMSYSSLYGFTLSGNTSLYGFTLSDSSLYGFTMSSQTIRKFSMEGVTVNTLDTTIATIIFGNYSKTITSRIDGAPRISYIDNSDALQIVDINI